MVHRRCGTAAVTVPHWHFLFQIGERAHRSDRTVAPDIPGCVQPLIRELFVSGDMWGCIGVKPPSPRQLVVQHFDAFHSKKLDRAPGLGLDTFRHPSHRNHSRFNMNYYGARTTWIKIQEMINWNWRKVQWVARCQEANVVDLMSFMG